MKAKWRDREFEIDRVGTADGYLYDFSEVELLDNLDYWEKLKHQYAGMAMQGLLSNPQIWKDWDEEGLVTKDLEAADMAYYFATALVNKLK